jgi:hypothetical protein
MTKAERMTIIVAGRLAAGDLERTYWADIILKAAKACDVIDAVAADKKLTYQDLRKMIDS